MTEFNGFGQFGKHLVKLAAMNQEFTDHMTETSADFIKKDAQLQIGAYQDQIGPYKAWDQLADSTKADRRSQGFPENEPLLRTGELRDSIEVSREGGTAVIGSKSDIALWQECGTPDAKYPIPPRPFLGPAAFASKNLIQAAAVPALVAWISGLRWLKKPQSSKLP